MVKKIIQHITGNLLSIALIIVAHIQVQSWALTVILSLILIYTAIDSILTNVLTDNIKNTVDVIERLQQLFHQHMLDDTIEHDKLRKSIKK